MAAVVFAFGKRPGLSANAANDLARLLELGRNLAAIELADRIRRQARLDPDTGEISEDVSLDGVELEQIASVFSDGPDLLAIPAYANLYDEVRRELSRH